MVVYTIIPATQEAEVALRLARTKSTRPYSKITNAKKEAGVWFR
jgi:hypothetical protein